MSKPSVVMNGTIPNHSAHAAGLRVSTINPNVFFRETSLIGEEITTIQAISSLPRDSYYRNKKQAMRNRNIPNHNDNKITKRDKKFDNKNSEGMNSRNRRQTLPRMASNNVTTESAIANSNVVSMDTRNGVNGMATKGHIVVLPQIDRRPAGSVSAKNEGGWGNSPIEHLLYFSTLKLKPSFQHGTILNSKCKLIFDFVSCFDKA